MNVKKVFISDDIDPRCPQILQEAGITVVQKTKLTEDQLIAELGDADGLIVRSATKVSARVLDESKLKLVGRAGTGVDNIDVKHAKSKDIKVMNTPAGNSVSAAELTCGMILSLARHIPHGHKSMKDGKWDRKLYMGNEVSGKTLAIVGLGRIGRMVAERMQAFGMKTIGFDPLVSPEDAAKFGVEWLSLDDIYPRADYITLHVPLIPPTANMINTETLGKCKRGVYIVNCARGGILKEDDVKLALDDGQLGGVGLDVYLEEPPKAPEHRLLVEHPKVVCTPHLGASTKEAQVRVAEEIAEAFVEASKGLPLRGLV